MGGESGDERVENIRRRSTRILHDSTVIDSTLNDSRIETEPLL